jgi:hypothetical protein
VGFLHLLRETKVHVHVVLAVGAVLGAYFASSVLRIVLIVLAVLLGALTAWDVLVAAYGILLSGVQRWLEHRRAGLNKWGESCDPPTDVRRISAS